MASFTGRGNNSHGASYPRITPFVLLQGVLYVFLLVGSCQSEGTTEGEDPRTSQTVSTTERSTTTWSSDSGAGGVQEWVTSALEDVEVVVGEVSAAGSTPPPDLLDGTPLKLGEMPGCTSQAINARYAEWQGDVTGSTVTVQWTYGGNVSRIEPLLIMLTEG